MLPVVSAANVISDAAPATAPGTIRPLFPSATGSAPAPFSDLLVDAVSQVNQLEEHARTAVTGLISGNGYDVHQAMIATEKASMAFEMTLAVRNKAVQAYQQVMNMQF
jgi:flagellar hook-basal body complex protein FliE